MLQIKGHCNFYGHTGYNIYSRNFFQALKQIYPKLSVRSYTSNNSSNDNINELVDEVTFFNGKFNQGVPINNSNISVGDINIILNETNHSYFYEKYNGIKIAYNLWETTQLPETFFNKLLEFDQMWVASQWQKEIMIKQGYAENKLFVIPGGVSNEFMPINYKPNDIIKFLVVGAWSFRKATKEIIETFLTTFKNINNVELILAVDNPYNKDNLSSTENRLDYYNLNNSKIKIKHFLSQQDYIKMLQESDVFLSCSRGEGWHMPLIEALACGKPSIFSNCSGQLEFAAKYPLKVNIIKEVPAVHETENINFPGNYYEPDFNHFSNLMLEVYNNLDNHTALHKELAVQLRNEFSWQSSAKKALNLLMPFLYDNPNDLNEFFTAPNIKKILDNNNSIYKEIFEYNIYNSIPEMEIKNNDIVLDVGAHIGIFSRYAYIKGASKVIAFEMDIKCFECLRKNVQQEDDVFNCLLLDKSFVEFKLENGNIINSFDLNYFYAGGLFKKIDFMKIDIVGEELILLYSILPQTYNVINKISIKCYSLLDEDKNLLINFMKTNGFINYHNILLPSQPIQLLYFWK